MPHSEGVRTAWGAIPKRYGGVLYPSTGEANYAASLDLRLTGRMIRSWRRAPFFHLTKNGEVCGRYRPDFEITHLDGRLEYVEVKGRMVREFAMRLRFFMACYPELKITVVDGNGVPYDPLARRRGRRLPIAVVRRLASAKRSPVRRPA